MLFLSLRKNVLEPLQRLGDRTREHAASGEGTLGVQEIASIDAAIAAAERDKLLVGVGRATQMLAHDVRRPFSLVRIGLDCLSRLEDDPVRLVAASRKMRMVVDQAMDTVQGLIADVMDASKSVLTLERTAVPVASLVGQSIRQVFAGKAPNQISFSYDFAHEHQLEVDLGKLLRVVTNIVDNARQAMGKGGTIHFTSDETVLNGRRMIQLKIRNTGSYIPPENLRRIFEAFFTHGKAGGTGLGLAIADKIVRSHEGTITCESSREQGTSFILVLPRSPAKDVAGAPLPADADAIRQAIEKELSSSPPTHAGIDAMRSSLTDLANQRRRPLTLALLDDDEQYVAELSARLSTLGLNESQLAVSLYGNPRSAATSLACERIDLGHLRCRLRRRG
jgi:signal transduction histidine kinase